MICDVRMTSWNPGRTHWVRSSGLLGLLALLFLTGCSSAAKQAFSELRGARGKVLLNQKLPASALRDFNDIQFNPATTTLGPMLCDARVPGLYDASARQVEQNLRAEFPAMFPGGAPQLVIGSEILYIRTKDLRSHAQFLVRVQMRGQGRLIVDALLNVQSKAFRDGDEEAMVEAALETIEEFLLDQKGGRRNADDDDE